MLPLQTLLQGRYRILRPLGEGGMGAVYEALDQRLDCLVALKEATTVGDEALRAFQREASLLANLRHRALPNVMDHFSEGNGQFLVMQFIPGEDLGQLLRQQPVFDVKQVLLWADLLLKTLEYLHGRNPPILHRDIKPSNLKLTEDGELFLLDFGLAKGSIGQMPTMQTTRSVWGHTRVYAPLEQILGTGTDVRSDLYSLGATLYHLITGQKPIDAATRYESLENGNKDPLPPAHQLNSTISTELSNVIDQAMAVGRRGRPESASAMRIALQAALHERRENKTGRHALPGASKHAVPNKSRATAVHQGWDEASFLRVIEEKHGEGDADVAKTILNWCKAEFTRIRWGHGKQDASFFPVLDWNSNSFYPIVVYTYGKIEIQFQRMRMPPFDHDDARLELLQRLNKIPGVSLAADVIKRRPSIPLWSLRNPEALNSFFETLAWILEQVKNAPPTTGKQGAGNDVWNGEFYVSFGVSRTRSWDDAREFGFISGGGGRWYSQTLQLLTPGARVWVKAPGYGFVGVGIVTAQMQPAASFKVETEKGLVPILDVARRGDYQRELVDDSELSEYFVPVQWLQTVPLERAIQETGMFGNQNTVCKPVTPIWRWTVDQLKKYFPAHNERGDSNTDLVELINSVGKGVFIRYYDEFADFTLSNQQVVAMLPAEYTVNSRNSRTSTARRIFREGLQKEALEIILRAEGVSDETRKGARDLLNKIRPE